MMLAVGSVVLASSEAKGEDLFTYIFETQGGTAYVRPVHCTTSIGYGWPDNVAVFRDLELTFADIGSTFIATEHNDADFNGVVSLLTDGVNQSWMWCREIRFDPGGGGGCGSWHERDLFGPDTRNGIDFAGYTIESFELTLDALSWETPGRDPNGDGKWTDHYFRGTLTITGTPEPATLGLLAMGGLAVVRRRKRRGCNQLQQERQER